MTIAVAIGATPQRARSDVLQAMSGLGFHGSWTADRSLDPVVSPDWWTIWYQRRLAQALREFGAGRVLIGHEAAGPADGGAVTVVGHGPLYVWVELPDSTWLSLRADENWYDPALIVEPFLVFLLIGVGIVGLAVVVARRVTAPLGRFAAAAAQLGANVDAPPLSETGPTEISRAASAFNAMQYRIKRFVEDRLHMLSAVSHDLRTPITRLRLRAEFVVDSEQRTKMLGDLDEMEIMIAETIAFAREETVREPTDRVDIVALLGEVKDQLSDGETVTVVPEKSIFLQCRRTALKRALSNIVNNALAYGGGRATIDIQDYDHEIVITVEDEGPGVPEDELENVFTPFYRIERSRNRDSGGAGLGLAVARTVVRGHGGDIKLANRPEGGLRQTVVLPRPI